MRRRIWNCVGQVGGSIFFPPSVGPELSQEHDGKRGQQVGARRASVHAATSEEMIAGQL